MTKPKLTIRQRKFALEYAKDGNASRAARDAGYSSAAAKEIGSRLLTYANIQYEVEKIMSKHAEEAGWDVKRVIENFGHWADQRDEKLAAASLKGSELIGKHLGMFKEQVDVTMRSHEEALKELE